MAKINISIELDKNELETLLGGEDEDCCNEYGGYSDNNHPEKSYTKQEMFDANNDELNWYKNFYNKHYIEFLRGSMTGRALEELRNRIRLAEQVVNEIKGE